MEALGIGSLALGGLSALFGANAAESAADTQSAAAQQAAAATDARWQQARADLLPFLQGGYGAQTAVQNVTGTGPGGNPLTAPYTRMFTPADLEATPGYQFTRDQGLRAVQNGFAAKGLGRSGAAERGAARYVTGLANNTYLSQLEADLKQRQSAFNMLMPQLTTGAGVGQAVASGAMGTQGAVNNLLTDSAKAQAAGDVGQANAWKGLFGPLSQYGMLYYASPDLFKQNVANLLTGAAPGRTA